jgi:hypothetical protein
MRSWKVLVSVILVLTLGLGLSARASAEVVGHITKVQGRVDLLKGGKLPATPAKLQEGVEPGDVLRVKSLSRAQITFIDNTIITLSPSSRLAIKAYDFHPVKKKRNAVLRIFRGLAHVVVSKVFVVEQPDFIIESNTAVTGVRGTDFGVRLQPNSSTILNFKGLVQVANIFPEVGQLSRRTAKVAYAFPPKNSPRSVLLRDMQGTTVAAGLPPTVPFTITAQDKKMFMGQLTGGLTSQKKGESSKKGSVTGDNQASSGGGGGNSLTSGGPESSLTSMVSSTSTSEPAVPNIAPVGLTSGTGSAGVTTINTVTVPPVNQPTPENITPSGGTTPTPTPVTYNFTQVGSGYWQTSATSPTSYNLSYQGWAARTMDENLPQYYLVSSTGTRDALTGVTFSNINPIGTSLSTTTGTVSGVPGGTLTGTADIITIATGGYQIISTDVPVSIAPDGTLSVLTSGNYLRNASGTPVASTTTTSNSYTPGQVFEENVNFTTLDQPGPPFYNVSRTITTSGSGTSSGVQTGTGSTAVLGGNFNLSAFYTQFMEQNGSFNTQVTPLDQTGTLVGVVAPDGQGGYSGVISNTAGDFGSAVVAGPVSLQSNQLNAMFIGAVPSSAASNIQTLPALWLQTPVTVAAAEYATPISGLNASSPTLAAAVATDPSYTFSLVNYIGWQALTDPSGTSATTQNYGWGYRTGVYSTFFTSEGNGTRIPPGDSTFSQQIKTGEAYGTGSGTVTGTLGSELTGSMTYLGTTSSGTRYTLNGTVTLLPTGEMTYKYTGSYADAATGTQDQGTSSGTITFLPGQYFQQASTGTVTITSSTDIFNNGPIKGTKFDLAVNNGAPQNFNAAFYVNVDQVTPGSSQNMIFYSQGVTSGNGGPATGAMTTYAVDYNNHQIIRMSGPVIVDADGTTTAWLLGADGSNNIKGLWIQSTDPNAELVIQAFGGGLTISTSPNSSTTGTIDASGPGILSKTSSSGTQISPSSTTLKATATETGGGGALDTEPVTISQILAGVVHADGSGPGHAIAYVPDNTIVFTDGTVYFVGDKLYYDFTGNWTSPDSQGTLSNGQLIDPLIVLDQSGSGALRPAYRHYMHRHHMHAHSMHRHYRRRAHTRAAAWDRHLRFSASTHHSSQALVADYINHAAIANIGRDAGAFSPTLTTASITETIDEGVVPGDTGATVRGARDIRTMTHRSARMRRPEGQMGFHGRHRGPWGRHHPAFAHIGPRGRHHRALSHRGPMRLHHRAFTHRGPMGRHHRALRHAPLGRRNPVVKIHHHLPAGAKINLSEKVH